MTALPRTSEFKLDSSGVTAKPLLLVSVRSLEEAEAAHRGGADIIDVKDPAAGPLGMASVNLCFEIAARYAGLHPVTAAVGELADYLDGIASVNDLREINQRLALVKLGTSRLADRADWPSAAAELLSELPEASRVVLVAYADAERARAPTATAVVAASVTIQPVVNRESCGRVAMVDTFDKRGPSLVETWSLDDLAQFVALSRNHAMVATVAGRIALDEIASIAAAGAHAIGVRGSACSSGMRERMVDALLVAKLRQAVDDWRATHSTRC